MQTAGPPSERRSRKKLGHEMQATYDTVLRLPPNKVIGPGWTAQWPRRTPPSVRGRACMTAKSAPHSISWLARGPGDVDSPAMHALVAKLPPPSALPSQLSSKDRG